MSNDRDGVQESQARTDSERFTFAQLPLAMRRDPKLKPIDLAVTMFILPWMRGRPYGWTTVEKIATGADVSERSVQYSLRRLKKTGWLDVQPSKINPTRREFTANWLTDAGFESLASGLGIDSFAKQVPQLVYSPKLSGIPGFAQYEEAPFGGERIFPLLLPEDSLMDSSNQHCPESPRETALNASDEAWAGDEAGMISMAPDDPEVARNAAAIERGVGGLFPSRLPRSSLGCAVNSIGRLVARCLDDAHSLAFHYSTLWRVVDGELSGETYLKAFREAMRENVTREGEPIQKRGARFVEILKAMEVRRTDGEFAEEWASQRGVAVA